MQNRRKIYFRADAGPDIGYGHYIRSLALADMLKQDYDCTMFTQSPTEYQLKEAKDVCDVIELPAGETRFAIFLDYLKGDEIVVLDNYFFTTDYQQSIKAKGCKLVCIDDMHDKHYIADAVINSCINNKLIFDVEPQTQLCLGAKYTLLRAPFLEKHDVTKSIKWIVSFGGSDPYDLTRKFVELLHQNGIKNIVAIVGDAYQYKENLEQKKGVSVLSKLSASEMAFYLAKTENIICSASTICYEALSQQCNVYAGWYVDNQKEFYEELVTHQLIIPLGNLLVNQIEISKKLNERKKSPLNFNNKYIRGLFIYLSLDCYNYIDLPDFLSQKVWRCRNLLEIRKCMSNAQAFGYDSHCTFIQKLKNDKSRIYLAWFLGDKFVASCSLSDIVYNKSANFGIFVNPLFHSMGIGSYLENQIELFAKENFQILFLKTEVLKTNNSSYHYNLSNGYILIDEDDLYYYFKKQLV